jgi:hypothetical protein
MLFENIISLFRWLSNCLRFRIRDVVPTNNNDVPSEYVKLQGTVG